VIYSSWAAPTAWRDSVLTSTNYKVTDVTAASVTASVLSSGLTLGYTRNVFLNNDGPFILPYTQNAGGTPATFSLLPAVGKVFYTFFVHDNTNFLVPSNREFRWVVIPGGVSGGRLTSGPAAGYTVDQIKSMNYSQIAAIFNIPANGTNVK
jgi:hypothetical protein